MADKKQGKLQEAMTPHRKKCSHVVHLNVPRNWFETNSRHQKCYSEGGQKIRGCHGLLGRVIIILLYFSAQEYTGGPDVVCDLHM